MRRSIPPRGDPEKSVFGIIGSVLGSDDGNLYIKYKDDSRNIGWTYVGQDNRTSTPTPTPTQTPSTTIYLSPTATPTTTPTPTVTRTVTPSISYTPTVTPTISYTPTLTPSSSEPEFSI
jgi:hypothetical protein